MEYKDLFIKSREVAKNAYAPFSKFNVGAALLASDGRVFTGVNVENSSFGGTICAERTAFTKAISEGVREFTAIAITGNGKEAWPCGICRQFMYEFAPDLTVITGDSEEDLQIMPLRELLPHGFKL
ncbi:MAG: cytidine deaminase [Aminipila sp.]